MRVEGYMRDLWSGKSASMADRGVMLLLGALSFPYAQILRLRAFFYRSGLLPSRSLSRPVISVGNITVGGAGKTPTVAMLARLLMERGKRVAVLSRGYGGSVSPAVAIVADGSSIFLSPQEAGDEPYLLARSVPGLMVVVGADRYRAGILAEERLNPDIFILDDGFQHQRLKRDVNILLLDCKSPFGNGRALPAGPLREPESALGRADLVIYTRCDGASVPAPIPSIPSCTASHVLTGAAPLTGGDATPFPALGGKGAAFAGIADPAAFFSALEEDGAELAALLPLPDHARYAENAISDILRLKEESGADYLITTEKDAVKLLPYLERLGRAYAARLDLRLHDMAPLLKALEKVL